MQMGSIIKRLGLDRDADTVWSIVRDFEQPDRFVPGFVTKLAASPTERILQFSNGTIALERLVTLSDKERRLVYSIIGGRASHYNSALEVRQCVDHTSELIWTIDVLPDELIPYIEENMNRAAAIMEQSLNAVH